MRTRIASLMVVAAALLLALPAAAQNVPSTMHYVGNLSDDGQAVNETVSMTFELYDAKTGGSVVWSETKMTVDVNNGKFAAELGTQQPLDDVFDGKQYWLQVTVDGEAMTPRTPAGMSPYAARAGTVGQVDYDNSNSGLNAQTQQAAIDELKAKIDSLESKLQDKADKSALADKADKSALQDKADKSTLQNDYAKKSELNNYVTKSSAQSTYATQSDLSNKADKSTLQNDYLTKNQAMMTYATKSQLSNYYTQSAADMTFAKKSSLSNYYTKTTADSTFAAKSSLSNYYTKSTADSTFAQKSKVSSIDTRVGDLENKTQDMSRKLVDGQFSVVFDDVNVHIRNGKGNSSTTDSDGNLIIGYNESPGTQTGSHNLVVGDGHEFTSYGGIVAGEDNTISAKYASVLGGRDNTAQANGSAVCGGRHNTAGTGTTTGEYSAILGGGGSSSFYGNETSGNYATVTAGHSNVASGEQSTVSGGNDNTASGRESAISGGDYRTQSSQDGWLVEDLSRDD